MRVESCGRAMLRLSRKAASSLAHLGTGLWLSLHHRIREEALRLQVARQGEELLSELAALLTRCRVVLEDARWAAGTYDLSASDQRGLIGGAGGLLYARSGVGAASATGSLRPSGSTRWRPGEPFSSPQQLGRRDLPACERNRRLRGAVQSTSVRLGCRRSPPGRVTAF